MSVQLNNSYLGWTPKKHNFIKNDHLRDRIHSSGYQIENCISQDVLTELNKLYKEEHDFNLEDGGMFYSMYSKDKAYRKRVHDRIGELLKPVLDNYFNDYKNVINSFVIKLPGEKSEFYVHQDTTALDEFKYSPLSLWIPLHDINEDNGALAIIEKTHWFFSPYRSISVPFPFKNINDTIKKYLKPIMMKKGEVLFFDNRMIHNSLKNISESPRVAIICGVFPKDASFVTVFKDSKEQNAPMELIQHNEDFLLNFDQFFYDCTLKPKSGKVVGEVVEHFPDMSVNEFESLCDLNNIQPVKKIKSSEPTTINCDLIAEPDGINKFSEISDTIADHIKPKTLLSRIKKRFNL